MTKNHGRTTGLCSALPVLIVAFTLLAFTQAPVTTAGTSPTLKFNGSKAYSHAQSQVSFGNRIPNTAAHTNCEHYITSTLSGLGLAVSYQNFTGTSGEGAGVPFVNIIGLLTANYTAQNRIYLAAHYDTRPFSDHDITKTTISPDYAHPVPGANDGASGVAVLLELARVLNGYNRTHDIYFLFFDGEDYGTNLQSMFYGSNYYATKMTQSELDSTDYLILLDMVGDSELTIHRESNSDMPLMDRIFTKAKDLGIAQFVNTTLYAIIDDHIPFRDRGMKVVDLIDFDYPNISANYWHTPLDTLDKISAVSLESVGKVVEALLYDDAVSHPSGGNNNTTPPPPPPPPPPPKPKPFIPGFEMVVVAAAVIIVILVRARKLDKMN